VCEIRIEVPKDKDGKKKRRQLKVTEKTSVSRNNDDTRKTLSAAKGVKSRASELSTRRTVEI
jgi:hypothetical protein